MGSQCYGMRRSACYLSLLKNMHIIMVDGGVEQKIVCPPSGVFTGRES